MYLYNFNNDVASLNNNVGGFRFYSTGYDNYCLGLKFQRKITTRKQLSIGILYSKSAIGYLRYTSTSLNEGKELKLQLNGIVSNTLIQYQVFKWLKINYGFSHYFNLVNRLNNNDIAKEVSWYNENNKSRMKKYSIAQCAGVEFKLYKRLSLEINTMRGLNKLITLKLLTDYSNFEFPQKLRYTGVTLNYRFH